MSNPTLILFAHGARDARWATPFQRLRDIVQTQLPQVSVSLAFLELMTPSLPDAVKQAVEDGSAAVTVVPIFLGQGGHILRDLPILTAQLKESYPQLNLQVATAVGEDSQVLQAIAQYCIGTLEKNQLQ